MNAYSTKAELRQIAEYLIAYMRIPYFQEDTVPGKVMEKILALVRNAEQLATYDYVDVVIRGKVGWQVKSTKATTPLTWKRAKIANADALIKNSEKSARGAQKLGATIIDFCNDHAEKSLRFYELDEIGYARLIMFDDHTAIYFERVVCTRERPAIFSAGDFSWKWSRQKSTKKKEQLSALHGTNTRSEKKAFAWHGRGENQLHFSGEEDWWPTIVRPAKEGEFNFSGDGHAVAFKLPSRKVAWEGLTKFLNEAS